MLFAGLTAAHFTAFSRGIPICFTAVHIHFIRLVLEPAIVPSSRVARFPFTITGCPPSSYMPSSRPAASMVSLMKITRSSPNILNVFLTIAGWICTLSQISSASQYSSSAAAMIGPGARWLIGFIALYRWVI